MSALKPGNHARLDLRGGGSIYVTALASRGGSCVRVRVWGHGLRLAYAIPAREVVAAERVDVPDEERPQIGVEQRRREVWERTAPWREDEPTW